MTASRDLTGGLSIGLNRKTGRLVPLLVCVPVFSNKLVDRSMALRPLV
jgi:hypothetical protein